MRYTEFCDSYHALDYALRLYSDNKRREPLIADIFYAIIDLLADASNFNSAS